MSNVNVCLFTGRLTKDPTIRYNSKETAICTFTLAVNRTQDIVAYPRIAIFGKAAEVAQEHLRKGRLICVQCSLHSGSYQNGDGNTVYTTEFRTNSFQFLDSKNGGNKDGNKTEPENNYDTDVPEDLDDLPNF